MMPASKSMFGIGRRPIDHPDNELLKGDDALIVLPLVSLLSNLRAFYRHPHLDADTSPTSDLLRVLQRLNKLQFLQISIPFNVGLHVAILSSLSSLSLRIVEGNNFDARPLNPSFLPLSLPSLTTLRLESMDVELLSAMETCWDMPNLENLDIGFNHYLNRYAPQIEGPPAMDILTPILQVYGARLRSLGLGSSEVDLQLVLRSCPNLLSLSFIVDTVYSEGTLSTRHEKLEMFGLHGTNFITLRQPADLDSDRRRSWTFRDVEEGRRNAAASNIAWLSKCKFPRLACIRLLSGSLLQAYVDEGGRSVVDESKSAGFLDLERRCPEEGIRLEDCTGSVFGSDPPSFVL